MKALSIRQPWAWAILNAGKDVENRDWKQGGPNVAAAMRLVRSCEPILIHASAGMTRREYLEYFEIVRGILHPRSVAYTPTRDDFDLGGIVGRARLAGVIHVDEKWGSLGGLCAKARASKWFVGPYGLALTEIKAMAFVPFKGALGFFNVPDDVARQAMGGVA